MDKKQNTAIAFLRVAEKILGIKNNIKIEFNNNIYFQNNDLSAMFIKEGYNIVFNNLFIEKASLIEIMITGFHEARHAYQYMQIEFGNKHQFKYPELQSTLIEWKKDFDNYMQPGQISKEEYLNRPTEIDAIAFSYYLADELLNVKQVIPDEIKEKVNVRIKEIKKTIII
ncbi:MAG TPA: hypothetical protein GX708_09600 [Gallicola sp.]|nr:hypothetical protein [Gallicola sp.]